MKTEEQIEEKQVGDVGDVLNVSGLPKSRQRIKERYPDGQYESDDDWEAATNKYMDEDGEAIGRYKSSERGIDELLSANPELLAILTDVQGGMPVKVAVVKNLDLDIDLSEDETDAEAWDNMQKEKASKAQQRADDDILIAKNEEASFAALDDFYANNDIGEDERQEFEAGLAELLNDLMQRKMSPEFIRGYHNSRNYDNDVIAARTAGEIEGKNAQIEQKIAKQAKQAEADGLPVSADSGADVDDLSADDKYRTNDDYYSSLHDKRL